MDKHWLKKGWRIERQMRGALTWPFWLIATIQHALPALRYATASLVSILHVMWWSVYE